MEGNAATLSEGPSEDKKLRGCRTKGRHPPKLPANVGGPPKDAVRAFEGLLIDDPSFLDDLDERSPCPKCNKSRKYFCYTCYVPVKTLQGKVPQVKLPIKVDIIKHSREIDGKSTAAHAAVLASEDVSIYTYPQIPDYDQSSDKVILIFPDKSAVSLQEHVKKLRSKFESSPAAKKPRMEESLVTIERVVFIDSTWNQSRGIYKDVRLKGLPCVVLKQRISQFWRHQEGSPRWYLATIEAVHQLLVELAALQGDPELSPPMSPISGDDKTPTTSVCPCHDYDNLLFFFKFMYDKIHKLYESDSLQAYKRPLDF